MVGKFLRLCAHFTGFFLGSQTLWNRHKTLTGARLKRATARQGIRLVGHASAVDRLAMYAVSLIVVNLIHG